MYTQVFDRPSYHVALDVTKERIPERMDVHIPGMYKVDSSGRHDRQSLNVVFFSSQVKLGKRFTIAPYARLSFTLSSLVQRYEEMNNKLNLLNKCGFSLFFVCP